MKRRLSSVSLLAFALGLAGCGGDISAGKSSSAGGSGATGSGGTSSGGSDGSATGGSAGSSSGGSAGESGSAGSSTGSIGDGGGKQIGAEDITYLGSFAVPNGDSTSGEESSFAYGGNALGYNPANDSLYFGGHVWYQKLAEVSIPSNFSQSATVIQDLKDVTDGKLGTLDDDANVRLTGTLVYDGKLVVAASSYYDADASQTKSHFSSGLDLSAANDAKGPFSVTGKANTRSKAGYMTPIPADWQSAFGGPALTGNCCQHILSATSLGPSATVFDPDSVGVVDPIVGSTVLFYPLDNPTTGNGTLENGIFKRSDQVVGIAFPVGSSSVLFIGSHGKGDFCYGPGTDDPNQTTGDGYVYCYDPVNGGMGAHAYPYVNQIWAYSAADLVAVKDGTKETWDVKPYAIFELTDIDDTGHATAAGATFDPATGRMFFTESYGENPKVHVFQIAVPN